MPVRAFGSRVRETGDQTAGEGPGGAKEPPAPPPTRRPSTGGPAGGAAATRLLRKADAVTGGRCGGERLMVHAGAFGEEVAASLPVVGEAAGRQDGSAPGADGDLALGCGDHGAVYVGSLGEQACGR